MRKSSMFVPVCVVAVSFLFTYAYAKQSGSRDNNPLGSRGGAGINWENPPGPEGGKGTSPEVLVSGKEAEVDKPWERAADKNADGIVDATETKQWKEDRTDKKDKSEVETGWERRAGANKDGIADAAEINQWKQGAVDGDDNLPGPRGGAGTNWENPPGPEGGKGASPNRRRDKF
jgi:hypothetical protein